MPISVTLIYVGRDMKNMKKKLVSFRILCLFLDWLLKAWVIHLMFYYIMLLQAIWQNKAKKDNINNSVKYETIKLTV